MAEHGGGPPVSDCPTGRFDAARLLREGVAYARSMTPEFRAYLAAAGVTGDTRVFTACADEPVSEVLARVVAYGGRALLVVPDESQPHGWALAWVEPAKAGASLGEQPHDGADCHNDGRPHLGPCIALEGPGYTRADVRRYAEHIAGNPVGGMDVDPRELFTAAAVLAALAQDGRLLPAGVDPLDVPDPAPRLAKAASKRGRNRGHDGGPSAELTELERVGIRAWLGDHPAANIVGSVGRELWPDSLAGHPRLRAMIAAVAAQVRADIAQELFAEATRQRAEDFRSGKVSITYVNGFEDASAFVERRGAR